MRKGLQSPFAISVSDISVRYSGASTVTKIYFTSNCSLFTRPRPFLVPEISGPVVLVLSSSLNVPVPSLGPLAWIIQVNLYLQT